MEFIKNFLNNLNKPKKPDQNIQESTTYLGLSPSSIRLMGLKEFGKMSEVEEKRLLKSEDRYSAYKNINTTTTPRKYKLEHKKGVVREMIEKGIISEDILKNLPTLYIGSGTGIEYPLALGAREIVMMDPVFQDDKAVLDLSERIKKIARGQTTDQGVDVFMFDFGNGPERITVHFIPEKYEENVVIPFDQVGLIIQFASQGPEGKVEIGKALESKVAVGGGILSDSSITRFEENKRNTIQFGK